MKALMTAAAALSMLAAMPAMADEALAKAKNCMACHAVDKKLVGPAYTEVAKKYADQGDAVDYLTGKIKSGGSGVWGPVPMPPNPGLSDDEAKTLAEWVMEQK